MTERQYAIDPNWLAEALGISPRERDVLLDGSEHPYGCRCDTCLDWWAQMGPDEDDEFGPFAPEEVYARQAAMAGKLKGENDGRESIDY